MIGATFLMKHIVVAIEEIHPYIPTDERPDLNVSLKYIDSYGLPVERRTQEVAAYPVLKLVSSDQHILAQSSPPHLRLILAHRSRSFLCSGFKRVSFEDGMRVFP